MRYLVGAKVRKIVVVGGQYGKRRNGGEDHAVVSLGSRIFASVRR